MKLDQARSNKKLPKAVTQPVECHAREWMFVTFSVRSLTRIPASISALLLAFCTLNAQSPSADELPIFRSRAELVTVPVVVTNKEGQPIEHLTKDDFVLMEDGKPQKIAAFDEITREVPTAKAAPSGAPSVASTPKGSALHITVLLLDL